MYEDMMKDVQNKMKPVTDMAEINKSTAEKLISLQTAYVTDLFNAGVAQMKALSETKEPKAAIELQVKYFKDLEAKLTNVAEQEIATLTAAKEQLTEIVEKGVSDMSEVPAMADVTKFIQTAQEKMTEVPAMAEMTKFMQTAQEQMTEAAKAFTPEAAAPAAKAPAKTARKAATAS
ncbi:phasin family protein [Neptunomonas japonica]|uniref:Granule-associated protein n=1 Tax=Neptunomonas japonica JAMM 1380 TaxID=1441457 RepID=A0A7R6PGG1_9GAMM|nr:phasin family protein [Neptunomonas japonica]BBB29752.1 granule-associated protein [Neptunomonas japonica JAMM 1380]